jgi:excisionase family DNA binding protein
MGRRPAHVARHVDSSAGPGRAPVDILAGAPAPSNTQTQPIASIELRLSAADRAVLVRDFADELERRARVAAQPVHLTVERTGELLHCDERTVRRLLARGELRGARLGGGRSRLLIEAASVDELLRRRAR